MTSSTLNDSKNLPKAVLDRLSSAKLLMPTDAGVPLAESPEIEQAPMKPSRPKRPAPGLLESMLWMVVYFIVSQLVPAVGLAFVSLALTGGLALLEDYLIHALFAGQILGVLLSVALLRWRVGRNWMAAVGLRRPALAPTLLAVLCLPALTLVGGGATMLTEHIFGVTEPSRQMVAETTGKFDLWFCILTIAIGAAVSEELFCRGFLGRGLVARHGVPLGVLLSTTIFAVLHLSIAQGVFAFILGLGIHFAYLATRSLWVPMLLHFLNNAYATLIIAAFPGMTEERSLDFLWVLAPAVLLAIPCAFALYKLRKRQPADDLTG